MSPEVGDKLANNEPPARLSASGAGAGADAGDPPNPAKREPLPCPSVVGVGATGAGAAAPDMRPANMLPPDSKEEGADDASSKPSKFTAGCKRAIG